MGAETAGEQTVAVSNVNDVTGAATGSADGTCHQVRPGIDILCRVTHYGWFAGGAARGVHTHDLFARHGEHAERIGFAQVLFGGERKLGEVFQ